MLRISKLESLSLENPLQPTLIFVSKALAYPSVQYWLLPYLQILEKAKKNLFGTNTLDYFAPFVVDKAKKVLKPRRQLVPDSPTPVFDPTEVSICGPNERFSPPIVLFGDSGMNSVLLFKIDESTSASQFLAHYSFTQERIL
jgi:hypothetical protein